MGVSTMSDNSQRKVAMSNSHKFLLLGGALGAGLMLLICGGVAVLGVGYAAFRSSWEKKERPAEMIVGTWVEASGMKPGEISFNADGSADLGGADRSLRFVRYRFVNDSTIQITSALEPRINFPMGVTFVSRNEMRLSAPEGAVTLKRVR
jgi:hypothetical protein